MNYFGQQPLAALRPLLSGQNLSDVADKALGRDNLEVFSRDETMLHSVPIGTIISFWGSTAPVGYLPCFGQTVNSATFPDLVEFLNPGQSSATLPEMRGEFLRGWDNGRGADLGRAIKTAQTDALQDHGHPLLMGSSTAVILTNATGLTGTVATQSGGDVVANTRYDNISQDGNPFVGMTSLLPGNRTALETRPRNISVLYCIKAYGAVISESTVDLGNVLSELTSTTKLSQFGASLSTNGYQYLPSGLIIQWGTHNVGATSGTITFPITFPNSVYSLTGSPVGNGAGGAGGPAIRVDSTSGATVFVWGTGNWSIRWIAIGR